MALLVTCGFISGTTDLWGCGHRIHSGGVGIPGPCSEGLVQGRDDGDLQEPAVCGWGWLPSRAAFGSCIFPLCPLGGPDVFHVRVLVTGAWHSSRRLNWPSSDAVSVSCHIWGCLQSSVANVKKNTKQPDFLFSTFWLLAQCLKKMHSTLDFFLLIMLNI